jgi:hypothetical protein
LVSLEELRDLLHQEGLSRKDMALLVLALEGPGARPLADVREIAAQCGVPKLKKWNISRSLGIAADARLARRVVDGWELTEQGRAYLRDKGWVNAPELVVRDVLADMRQHANNITNAHVVQFLEEAITCLEAGVYRAAVVFSWVGAAAMLHAYVFQHQLAQFNAEAPKHDTKWKDAKTVDDFGKMREFTFLETIAAMSVISPNVKQALEECLKRRNACGHHSSYQLSQRQAVAHLETLMLNVYSKF